jgi:hypothetical protein
MELTILMPCLNEALTVETCIRKARAYLERRRFAKICSITAEHAYHEEIDPLDKGHAQGAVIAPSQ